MGNGDTSSGGYNMGGGAVGGEDESREAAAAFLESDAGLGMNMQHTVSSYHCNKMTNFMPPSPYYHHDHLHKHQAPTEIGGGLVFGNETSINNQIASGISLEPSTGSDTGGATEASGKVLFTATQWQELERQTMIYKYIMASVPVPPQLLIPLSTQSNKAGMDLRFSSGSDPEPWRCRRTDGKKWRCSRDVAPDQKYCERHAHKSRPRSRKPVEIQSHNTNITPSAINITPAPAYTNTLSNTDMLSAATSSYQHPRCTEWFMKSGTIPVSSSNQAFQQSMHSPRVGSKRNHIFPQDFEGNYQHESHLNYSNLHLDTTSSAASDASAGARRQHFIDAWSRSGGGDHCSLTLSMQCSGGIDDNNQSLQIGVGMLDVERGGSGDILKSHNQWLNQSSWMGSPPGGPLGEALGLGIASTVKGPLNVPSPHGHSSSTTTSSLCENGGSHGHELSFIR